MIPKKAGAPVAITEHWTVTTIPNSTHTWFLLCPTRSHYLRNWTWCVHTIKYLWSQVIFVTTPFGLFRVLAYAFWPEKCSPDIPAFHGSGAERSVICVCQYWEHTEYLRAVFDRLTTNGIVVNTVLGVKELDDQNGITPLQSKVQLIPDFPQPTSQRQLRHFMGMINFYHHFIPHRAELLHPLHALIKTNSEAQGISGSKASISQCNSP